MDAPLTGLLAAFTLTVLIVELTPGPNMAYLIALSLSNGLRSGFAAVAGIALGLSIYGFAAAFGIAAIIERSALLYEALRWTGVFYFLWLAWEDWKSEEIASEELSQNLTTRPLIAFGRGLMSNLLNPKAAIFYIAVLPEFTRIERGAVEAQTLMLSATYVGIATCIHSLIVLLAGSLQSKIVTHTKRQLVRRIMALLLVGIAIWLAIGTKA